jgi:hypothetical protein
METYLRDNFDKLENNFVHMHPPVRFIVEHCLYCRLFGNIIFTTHVDCLETHVDCLETHVDCLEKEDNKEDNTEDDNKDELNLDHFRFLNLDLENLDLENLDLGDLEFGDLENLEDLDETLKLIS